MPVDFPFVIRERLQGLEEAKPGAITFPAGASVTTGTPGAVPPGDIAPRRTNFDAPEDAIEDASVISIGVAG